MHILTDHQNKKKREIIRLLEIAKCSQNNEKSFSYLFNVQIMQKILFYSDFLKAVQIIEVTAI